MGMDNPWLLVHDVDALPGRGMDQAYGNGPALQTMAATTLRDFMSRGVEPARRVILVPDIGDIPWHLQFLAVMLGAHVREHVLKPCFRYSMLGPGRTLAFTQAFAQKHKKVVQVAREAIRLQIRCGGKSPLHPRDLKLVAVGGLVSSSKNQSVRDGCASCVLRAHPDVRHPRVLARSRVRWNTSRMRTPTRAGLALGLSTRRSDSTRTRVCSCLTGGPKACPPDRPTARPHACTALPEVADLAPEQALPRAAERTHAIIYLDEELQEAPMAAKRLAKSFPEFMRGHVRDDCGT